MSSNKRGKKQHKPPGTIRAGPRDKKSIRTVHPQFRSHFQRPVNTRGNTRSKTETPSKLPTAFRPDPMTQPLTRNARNGESSHHLIRGAATQDPSSIGFSKDPRCALSYSLNYSRTTRSHDHSTRPHAGACKNPSENFVRTTSFTGPGETGKDMSRRGARGGSQTAARERVTHSTSRSSALSSSQE